MLKDLRISIHEFSGAFNSALKREGRAFINYLNAAKLGSLKSQNEIATRYLEGVGVAQDLVQAIKWYQYAAEQGYCYSQANMGWCYHTGKGVVQNYEKAFEWYMKAAENGHPVSQYHIGKMCAEGIGTGVNITKALHWLKLAKGNGVAEANELLQEVSNGT